jgi:hypothetical protein
VQHCGAINPTIRTTKGIYSKAVFSNQCLDVTEVISPTRTITALAFWQAKRGGDLLFVLMLIGHRFDEWGRWPRCAKCTLSEPDGNEVNEHEIDFSCLS